VITALVCALAVAAVIEIARARNERVRTFFQAKVGGLLRPHEIGALSGATWLIVALLVAAVAFPRDVAIAAMGAVTVGDAAAAIIGQALTASTGSSRKSLAGSVACFAASALMARAIANFAWREALLVGLVAAMAERPRRPFDDNLRIAIAVGCGILLWRMGFS
jgi:dolichol kinase